MSNNIGKNYLRKKTEYLKQIASGKHNTRYLLSKFKCEFSLKEYDKLYNDVGYLRRHEDDLFSSPVPKDYLDIRKKSTLFYSSSFNKELEWCIYSILKYKELIGVFINERKEYEKALLLGKYELSRSILSRINSQVGSSLWAVESEFLLNELEGGFTQNLEFLSKFCGDETDVYLLILAQFYSRKSEKNITIGKFNEFFTSLLGESTNEFTNYFHFKFNSKTFLDFDSGLLLQTESSSPIIDRYITLLNLAKFCIAYDIKESEILTKNITQYLNELSDLSVNSIHVINYLKQEDINSVIQKIKPDNICECVDLYACGKYQECISACKVTLAEDPTIFELYPCLIKSCIHLDIEIEIPFESDSIAHQVMESMMDIYQLNSRSQDSLGKLIKIYFTLGKSDFACQLFRFVVKYLKVKSLHPYSIQNIASSAYALSFLETLDIDETDLPFIYSVLPKVSIAIAQKAQTAVNPTFALGSGDFISPHELSIALRRAKYLSNCGDYEDAEELLNHVLAKARALHQREYGIYLLYDIYLNKNIHLKNAIILVVDNYIENQQLIRRVDLLQIKNKIIGTNTIDDIGSIDDIHLVCLLSILEKERLLVKDEGLLHVAFANYLAALEISKPSELLPLVHNFRTDILTYFLSTVCQIDVLDYLAVFSGTDELENERISICQMLRNIDSENKKKHDEEISAITQQVTIRKRIQQVDEGKISVDMACIVTSSDDSVVQLYNRYKSLEDIAGNIIKLVDNSYIAALINNIEQVKQEKPRIVFVRDPKYKLFKELFYEIRDRFVFSNEYGLDSNLSVRIRHGTLKGELRRPFNEGRLLTTKNKESGIYYENSYWRERLSCLEEGVLDEIVVMLTTFSASIDDAISDVPSKWIQVKTEQKDSEGMFDYAYSDVDLSLVYLKVIDCQDLDELLAVVMSELWARTENNLLNLRKKLNFDFKEKLLHHMNELERNLRKLIGTKEDFNIQALFRSISTCRTNMQNDINNVIKWFSISTNKNIIDFNMAELVDTCIQILKKIYPTILIDVHTNVTDKAIYPGNIFESLVIVLLNLLDNACKYGNINDTVEAYLDIHSDGPNKYIKATNIIPEDTNIAETVSIIENIKRNIKEDNVADALRKEGRTGFYKIHNILASVLRCQQCDINIDITDEKRFKVELILGLG